MRSRAVARAQQASSPSSTSQQPRGPHRPLHWATHIADLHALSVPGPKIHLRHLLLRWAAHSLVVDHLYDLGITSRNNTNIWMFICLINYLGRERKGLKFSANSIYGNHVFLVVNNKRFRFMPIACKEFHYRKNSIGYYCAQVQCKALIANESRPILGLALHFHNAEDLVDDCSCEDTNTMRDGSRSDWQAIWCVVLGL